MPKQGQTTDNSTYFRELCERTSKAEEAREFLESQSDPSSFTFQDEKNTPLHFACRNHNSEILRVIVEAGCDVNKKNNFHAALFDAFYHRPKNIKHATDQSLRLRRSPFFDVAIPLFEEEGFDWVNNKAGSHGETILHVCADKGLPNVIQIMGQDILKRMIFLKDRRKRTPLHAAERQLRRAEKKNLTQEIAYFEQCKRLLEDCLKAIDVECNGFVENLKKGDPGRSSSSKQSNRERSKSSTQSQRQTSSTMSRPKSSAVSGASTSISRTATRLAVGMRVKVPYQDGRDYYGHITSIKPDVKVKFDDFPVEPLTPECVRQVQPTEKFEVHQLVKWDNKLFLVEKKLPGNLYDCSLHGKKERQRVKGRELEQLKINDEVYAFFPQDSKIYRAYVKDFSVKEQKVTVQYVGYDGDTELKGRSHLDKIYSAEEWRAHQQKQQQENRDFQQKQKSRSHHSHQSKSENQPNRRAPENQWDEEIQKKRASSSHETHSSYDASVDRSVSVSAPSPHHAYRPKPVAYKEEDEIKDPEYWKVLSLLPTLEDEPSELNKMLRAEHMSRQKFWKITGKLDEFFREMYDHHKEEESRIRQYYEKRISDLELNFATVESKDEALEKKIRRLQSELVQKEKQIQELEHDKSLSHKTDDELFQMVSNYHEKIEKLEFRIICNDEEIEMLKKEKDSMLERNVVLRNEKEKLEVDMRKHEMESIHSISNDQIEVLEAELVAVKEENCELRNENKELQDKVKKLDDEKCLCGGSKPCYLAYPCGHLQFCDQCKEMKGFDIFMERKQCAHCKSQVDEWVKIQR